MTRKIIKQEENYTALTKEQTKNNFRHHKLMMLEAMQYKGPTHQMSNSQLHELVEEQKLLFVRKIQAQKELQEKYGRPIEA
jgi:microcompartment protein CcmK/EutM